MGEQGKAGGAAQRIEAVRHALDGVIRSQGLLQRTLAIQGLTDPSAAVAYRAVLHATGSAELAWEAARQQQLVMVRATQLVAGQELAARHADALLDLVSTMPNPFAPSALAVAA